MKTLLTALLIMVFSATISHADEWAKAYGGSDEDWTFSIQETATGEYITSGYTYSFGAGESDAWVVKLNSDGTVSWQNSYGGSDYDWAYTIQEISDPGYLVAGYTESFGAGGADAWILKLSNSGTVTWAKAYGGAASEEFYSVQEVSTGGYIAAGRTTSFGTGESDAWVVKLDSDGNITWEYRYGINNAFDSATSIQETTDGGYVLLVESWNGSIGTLDYCVGDPNVSCINDSDCEGGTGPCIHETRGPFSDIVVVKLDANGWILWQKNMGELNLNDDTPVSILQTSDGGYILAANTRSFGGISKPWVLKLTSSGAISWQKTYGGDWSYATSFKETSDSNYIMSGYTFDYGAGFSDAWLLKIEGESGNPGDIMWQKTYGGSDYDWAYSALETSTGEYLVAGRTWSYGAGYDDTLILKLDSSGGIPDCGMIDTSTAIATDTTIYAADEYLAITATSTTVTDTSSVSVLATTATAEGICPVSGVDSDVDGIPDALDNCPDHPNGPNQGICTEYTGGNYIVSNGQYCTDDGECDEGEYCEKEQADHYPPGGNGIGDACDCEADFNCSGGVDSGDVGPFLEDWNKRTIYSNPCTNEDPCTGDFNCSKGVDSGDVGKFLEDWNKRTIYSNPCPACAGGSYQPWCVYTE